MVAFVLANLIALCTCCLDLFHSGIGLLLPLARHPLLTFAMKSEDTCLLEIALAARENFHRRDASLVDCFDSWKLPAGVDAGNLEDAL